MSMLKSGIVLLSAKKKKMVLGQNASKAVKPESTRADEKSKNKDNKSILWTCNFSAPNTKLMLFDMDGAPVYHVSIFLEIDFYRKFNFSSLAYMHICAHTCVKCCNKKNGLNLETLWLLAFGA